MDEDPQINYPTFEDGYMDCLRYRGNHTAGFIDSPYFQQWADGWDACIRNCRDNYELLDEE